MEGSKQVGSSSSSSSSSIASQLFGSKEESASTSSGIFNSIFAPSSKVFGGESLRSEAVGKKLDSVTKALIPESVARDKEGECKSPGKKEMSSFYNEQKVQPCHLSSSIYYGGQDIYSDPQSTQAPGYPTVSKEGGEDDGTASRGNWWQGSLYY